MRHHGRRPQPQAGDRVQVSRLGNPLVNEVVVPARLKDAFNALSPDEDASIAGRSSSGSPTPSCPS